MFKNNIEILKNNRLKTELMGIDISECTAEISFVETLDGNVVFLKGGIPVEETTKPIEYVKSIITDDMKQFAKNDVIVSVGFGVGYILDELYSSTQSKIVIYEPDIKYLRFIFETIDLTKFLADKRVFISDSKDECLRFILKTYLNDDKIDFVQSKVLAIFYQEEMKEFIEELYSRLKNKIIDINTIRNLSKLWVNNVVKFISKNKKYYSIESLKDKCFAKNALVLGAGPSLEDNIEFIKTNRESLTIFAVNKTLSYLEKNGIVPDFAVFADAKDVVRNSGVTSQYMKDVTTIRDWKSDIEFEQWNVKNECLYFSDNELFLNKYAQDLGMKLSPSFQSSTILALLSANTMGFSKIYMCGFDLVFKDSQAYAADDNVEIENNKAVVGEHARNLVQVDTIKGEKAYTREDYAAFISSLEELIKAMRLSNLYNITDFGALIKGMNYTSFDSVNVYSQRCDIDEIFESVAPADYDFKSCLASEKQVMNDIYSKVMSKAPIGAITKSIMENTSLLYEYMQFEMLELSRNIDNQAFIDKFYSNCILAIDKILAL